MTKSSFRASGTQQGLTENMQILTGQKGDRLDKALTLREAASLGMVSLRRNSSGAVVPELPPDKPTDPEWSGVQPPVAPTNVTADGAFQTITLTWDIPGYKGHAYAEVLRAEVDNPAISVAIGTTLANVYSDSVGKGFTAYYWVRFINKNGLAGPLHSTAGLKAKTSPNVDEIIASATHFAIYNPARPDQKEIIFGVTDDGRVAIKEAVIKAATIQILHSEKITADYIKAGVSISAPLITGGQFDMGNAFMAGGSAGFGKGGPYAAWGWGWYTMIYSDGSLFTNRLRAEGGYVKNMSLGNCTIEQDCVVKGTIYAEKIVGDIVRTYALNPASAVQLPAMPFARKCTFMVTVSSGTSTVTATVYVNGVAIGSLTARDYGLGQGSTMNQNFEYLLAANRTHTISYDRDNKDYPYASSSCLSIVCLA
jgi:predicted phage tail protein